MITDLRKKFGSQKNLPAVSVPSSLPSEPCSVCDGFRWWQPDDGSKRWLCERCEPPASPSRVLARRDANEHFEYVVMAGVPVCEACRGALYVESWDARSIVKQTCWTCRRPVDGEPKPHLATPITIPKRYQK